MEGNETARGDLTEAAIAALKKPAKGRKLLYDRGEGSVTGFAVMVTASGHKSFVLGARYPATKSKRRKSDRTPDAEPAFARRFIGRVGDMSLVTARAKAKQWRELIAAGTDPAEHEAAEKRAVALKRADSFEIVAKTYLGRYVSGINDILEIEPSGNVWTYEISGWTGRSPPVDLAVKKCPALDRLVFSLIYERSHWAPQR